MARHRRAVLFGARRHQPTGTRGRTRAFPLARPRSRRHRPPWSPPRRPGAGPGPGARRPARRCWPPAGCCGRSASCARRPPTRPAGRSGHPAEVSGSDELADLARTFNDTAAALEHVGRRDSRDGGRRPPLRRRRLARAAHPARRDDRGHRRARRGRRQLDPDTAHAARLGQRRDRQARPSSSTTSSRSPASTPRRGAARCDDVDVAEAVRAHPRRPRLDRPGRRPTCRPGIAGPARPRAAST